MVSLKSAFAASLLLGLLIDCNAADERATLITVLHTNDHHGRFWKSADNEYGLAARKTLIDRIRSDVRAQGGYTLLIDGGDVNTGVPESDTQDAEPDFRGMSRLGYDAMVVGNHEFDKSAAVLHKQHREWSTFPWLSANIYKDGSRMFEPYRLFQLGGVKVAVLGLTTNDTAKMLASTKFPGVDFRPPAREAAMLVPMLRRKADIVIAATHMGHYPNAKRGVNAPGDVELARSTAGIDLIVGGHSHSLVCMARENVRVESYRPGGACAPDRQNGTWIVQAGEWGKFVGRMDLEYSAGELKLKSYTLIPVNLVRPAESARDASAQPAPSERIAEDADMLALLRPFQERGAAGLSVEVGRSDGKFDGDRASVRSRPTNLGVLITSAMMDITQADAAIVSSGGIRDSLPAGTLTYRDLLRAQPFGNHVVVVSMTGTELDAYLRAAAAMTPGSGAFAQTSGVDVTGGAARQLLVGGRPLDPNKTYRLAINSFVAKGGDGYPDMTGHPGFFNTGHLDVDVLREFIARQGVLRTRNFEPHGAIAAGHL